jgi:hypothetical protein
MFLDAMPPGSPVTLALKPVMEERFGDYGRLVLALGGRSHLAGATPGSRCPVAFHP